MPGEEAKQPRLETWHCPSWDSQLWVSFPSLYHSIQIWKLVMVRINAKHLAQGASLVADCKESTCNARGPGSIPGSGRSSGEQNGYPLQYPCLENPKDIGAGQAIVHWGHKESDTAEQHTHTHTHTPYRQGVPGVTQLCAFTDAHLSTRSRRPEQCLVLTAAPVLRFVWSLLSTCSKLCQGPPREEYIRSQATFKSGWPVLTPLTMKPEPKLEP